MEAVTVTVTELLDGGLVATRVLGGWPWGRAAGAEWAGGQALKVGDAREALASASRRQRDGGGIGGGARERSAAGMGTARAVPPIRRRFGGLRRASHL